MNLSKTILRSYFSYSQREQINAKCKGDCCFFLEYPQDPFKKLYFQFEVDDLDNLYVEALINTGNQTIYDVNNDTVTLRKFNIGDRKFVVIEFQAKYEGLTYFRIVRKILPYYYSTVLISDFIKVCKETKSNINIAWTSSCNLVGNQIFPPEYIQEVYFDCEIVNGESEIEQEIIENPEGDEEVTFQILKQKYYLDVLVPNYLAEALTTLPLFQVKIDGESANYIQVVPENDEKGCNSKTKISYEIKRIKKGLCCDGENLIERSANYNKEQYSGDHYNTSN